MNDYSPREAVEIFHLLFLRFLENKIAKQLYVLKGGCNLRFFFKSIRYSEDMDIDIHTVSREVLKKNVNQLLSSTALSAALSSKGIEIGNPRPVKQTDTTQRWKLSIRLNTSGLEYPTKVEFSRRRSEEFTTRAKGQTKFKLDTNVQPVDPELINRYGLYPVIVQHYNIQAAAIQKLEALQGRSETQARDIFDLAMLTERGLKLDLCVKSFSKAFRDQLIGKIEQLDFEIFQSQVVAYLDPHYQEFYGSKSSWQKIESTVIHALEEAQ